MNANVVLDLNELAEYVASKALKIIEEKQKPVITNAQKFKEVFGSRKLYEFVNTDLSEYVRRSTWWDEPYKEPKE